MSKIIWKGNIDWNTVTNGKQEWDKEIKETYIPNYAVYLKRPDNIFKGLTLYFIIPIIICFIIVFIKRIQTNDIFIDFRFFPLSLIIGFFVGMPLHELCHALCYYKESKVYIGISLRQLRAFCISPCRLKRNRFILMALSPSLLGILFIILFLITPVSMKWLITISMIPMFMGLISPAPDYRDIVLILKQVPKNAYIQPGNKGYIWYQ